ncbi:MAG: VWA domain-containing protein, partial [Peptococcaceae bacterium]|nr:VWA domain-containing protein [Peptococcaceae bacterium]
MKYFSKNKKWMAYLILLTFLFTSIIPSNLGSMNSMAEAASLIELKNQQETKQIVDEGGSLSYKGNAIADNYDVQVTKTVSPTGTENDFNIELKVVTSENVEALSTIKTGAAVVLVMDTSKSMQWDASGGGHCFHCNRYINDADAKNLHNSSCEQKAGDATYARGAYDSNEADEPMRITTAVQVANSFLTEFAKFDTAMFSLVTFDSNAFAHRINEKYWLNVGKEDTEENLTDVQTEIAALDNYYEDLSEAEKTPAVHSGTNIAGGLLVAYNLLNNLGSDAPAHRYIILLSDGAPNKGNSTDDTGYSQTGVGNGNGLANAKTVADRIHALKDGKAANVYSVGFSPDLSGSNTVELLRYIASDPDDVYYDYAATPDDLIADISEITTNVTKLAEAWQVTD